jgi:DNA invertase Pin-like site-specific DNA recombinase
VTRCVIYCRVSSEEQAAEGKTSIQTQLTDCREMAAKLGYVVVGEYVDDKRFRVGKKLVEPSGSRADRPGWLKTLAALREGRADVLVSWHSTRLFRAYRPMVDLLDILDERPAARVELVKESFNKDTAVLYAWVGRKENESRTERMRFGKIGRARKGMSATSTPRCYKPVRDPDTGATLGYDLDPAWRASLDEMARLFLGRQPYRAIAQKLGVNPRSGKPFNQVTVYKLLHNPFLFGTVEFGRASRKGEARFTLRGRHPPAWDDETCARLAVELVRRDQLGSHAPRQLVHPFSGLLRCGYCGRPMTASLAGPERRNPDGRLYRYYYCQHNRLAVQGYYPGPVHPPNGIPEHKLIALVADQFSGFDAEDLDTIMAAIATLSPAERGDDTATRAQLTDIERQTADLESDLARVRSDRARAGLAGEIAALQTQAALLREQLARAAPQSPIDAAEVRAAILEVIDDPQAFFVPDDQLRYLLNRLFVSLYVRDGELAPKPAV